MESASIIRSNRGVPVLSIFVEQAEAGCAIDRTILDARDEERIRMFSNRWTRPGPSCANDRGHSSRRVATESSFSVLASLTTRTPWNNRSNFLDKMYTHLSLGIFQTTRLYRESSRKARTRSHGLVVDACSSSDNPSPWTGKTSWSR